MALLALQGLVATAPQETRDQVNECTAKVRELIATYGEAGSVAIMMIALAEIVKGQPR